MLFAIALFYIYLSTVLSNNSTRYQSCELTAFQRSIFLFLLFVLKSISCNVMFVFLLLQTERDSTRRYLALKFRLKYSEEKKP